MKRSLLVAVVLGGLLAGPVAAKGPSKATIAGPGLENAVVLAGDAEGNTNSRFARFVQQVGFFQQVFVYPGSTTSTAPPGKLGPRYDVVYAVPGPDNDTWTIRQELYPYAAAGPLTYIRPGQVIFTSMKTQGGWYRSPVALRHTLSALGFPERAPALEQSGLGAGAWAGIGAVIAVGVVSAAALAYRRRRSSQAAS